VASVEGRGGKDGHVPTARKWRAWGDCHKTPHIFGAYSESKEIVLVEDLISANKVAAAGIPAIPLFGTRVFASAIPCLRHVGLPIVLWLDKDQEGTMARKAAGLATMTGLPVRYIVTNDDPKTLPIVKIKELLNVPY
jgi:DNA primase